MHIATKLNTTSTLKSMSVSPNRSVSVVSVAVGTSDSSVSSLTPLHHMAVAQSTNAFRR